MVKYLKLLTLFLVIGTLLIGCQNGNSGEANYEQENHQIIQNDEDEINNLDNSNKSDNNIETDNQEIHFVDKTIEDYTRVQKV